MNEREAARETLTYILILANLRNYPSRPDDYRQKFEQLTRDYPELEQTMRVLFPENEPLGTRRVFDSAIGNFVVHCVSNGRLQERLRPGNYRPISLNIPYGLTLMAPLYAARLAQLMGEPKNFAAQAAA